ncbi:sulfite exporter TauE/SafE family protein [Candidatus Electronema sp. JC]|uniref:sulfite exporter TauE/SafE family protein n=1 Tax=Candidatus Electronema sp. JC TaxID=3401570 RepID=UPI003AA7CA0B
MLTINWLMLPAGTAIAAVAMFFGLGGAVLWMPVLLTFTTLKPDQAVMCTVVMQSFAQFSATVSNSRAGLISWPVVKLLAAAGLPGVLVGVLLSSLLHPIWMELFLGLAIFFIAYAFMRGDDFFIIGSDTADLQEARKGRIIAAAGSVLTGLLGIGVGDWLVPFLNMRCGLSMPRAVATCVALMFILSVTAAAAHFLSGRMPYLPIVLPGTIGVLIGAQLGSKLLQRVPETRFKELFVLMLVFVATHVTFNAL